MKTNHISQIFRSLDRELWIVTAGNSEQRGGMISTTVCQASIVDDLPRIIMGVGNHHFTHELIAATGCFVLNTIAENQLDRLWSFGLETGHDIDKLAGFRLQQGTTGTPILADAPAWLECKVEASFDTGDRTLFLAEVLDGHQTSDEKPLTIQQAVKRANASQLQALMSHKSADGLIEAAAIRKWRDNEITD
jgi:flavin reductase (DIM6/NTAB) family NADH-FMN oxidoreductase RutF